MKFTTILVSLFLGVICSLSAQVRNFLEVTDIEGSSLRKGFEDQIEVLAYDLSVANSAIQSGTRTVGKVSFAPLGFTAFIDEKALPKIVESTVLNTVHKEVILSSARDGASGKGVFLEIKLEDAIFVGVDLAGTSGEVPVYEFRVDFSRITVKTIPVDSTTGQSGTPIEFTYDKASATTN